MKKENYRAEREFTSKAGAGAPLFEAGWLGLGGVLRRSRALPLGFLRKFSCVTEEGKTLSHHSAPAHGHGLTLPPMDHQQVHTTIPFQSHSIPAVTAHTEKPRHTLLCMLFCRLVGLIHLLLPKASFQTDPSAEKRGEG